MLPLLLFSACPCFLQLSKTTIFVHSFLYVFLAALREDCSVRTRICGAQGEAGFRTFLKPTHTHTARVFLYTYVCVCLCVCLCVCVSVCLCGHHIGETHSEAPLTHTAHFRLFGAVICHVPSSPHVSMFFAPIRRSGPCGGHLQEAAGGLPGVSAGAHGGCAHGGSSQQLVG